MSGADLLNVATVVTDNHAFYQWFRYSVYHRILLCISVFFACAVRMQSAHNRDVLTLPQLHVYVYICGKSDELLLHLR